MGVDIGTVGAKEWNDSAERGEWAFMAKMLREAQDSDRPGTNSGVGVAINIADERAKSGWRDVTDTDSSNPETWGKMNDRHAMEKATALSALRDEGLTQTQAADKMGMPLGHLNSFIIRNGIPWTESQQGKRT